MSELQQHVQKPEMAWDPGPRNDKPDKQESRLASIPTEGEGEGDDERPNEPPASDSGTDSDSESGAG